MNLVNTLLIVAAVALILFIIKFLRQIAKIKRGNEIVSRGSVVINWILAIVFIVGIGGAGYLHFMAPTNVSEKPRVVKKPSASKPTKTTTPEQTPLKLSFRNDVTMDSDDSVHLKITVSAGAKVTIEGRNTGEKYASFTAPAGSGTVTKVVNLDNSGPYKVIARRGSKKISKNLIVRDNTATAADVSTSSSISSSQPVSSSSSSQTTAVTSNRNSQTTAANQTARSNATNTANQ